MNQALLVSGCSFTMSGLDYQAWPVFLQDEFDVLNLAFAGAGNEYICNSIIDHCLSHQVDRVAVMWSGFTRLDQVISTEEFDNSLISDYSFRRKLNDKVSYVFSGGLQGSWKSHSTTSQMFKPAYQFLSNESMIFDGLITIIKLQNFLKARYIPYVFSSFINYWDGRPGSATLNCAGEQSVNQFPDLESTMNHIDFSNFFFFDQNKTCLGELAQTNNWLSTDKWHPSSKAGETFANCVRPLLR